MVLMKVLTFKLLIGLGTTKEVNEEGMTHSLMVFQPTIGMRCYVLVETSPVELLPLQNYYTQKQQICQQLAGYVSSTFNP